LRSWSSVLAIRSLHGISHGVAFPFAAAGGARCVAAAVARQWGGTSEREPAATVIAGWRRRSQPRAIPSAVVVVPWSSITQPFRSARVLDHREASLVRVGFKGEEVGVASVAWVCSRALRRPRTESSFAPKQRLRALLPGLV
jgi:hypothetical protein